MGQQQLLLLILGIVIVGLAIVVGINAFSDNQVKSTADALVADGLRIASDAQAWAIRPKKVGGGGGAAGLASLAGSGSEGWAQLGYPTDEETPEWYTNPNGYFGLGGACGWFSGSGQDPTIPSGNTPNFYIVATDEPFEEANVQLCIGVAGTNADDIGTAVVYLE